jgi:hypothetical protein
VTTPACNNVADYVWLTGDEASAVLADLANDSAPLHALVARLRGKFSAEKTHLLLEQVELRRRASAKFTRAAQMYFTRVGLEQATDEWIAAYKAERFTTPAADSKSSNGQPKIADLCCGIGGDLSAFAAIAPTIGVDRNPIAAHFASVNSVATVQAIDVADLDLDDVAAVHIDPDRRPSGHRTTSLEFCEPDLATLQRLIERVSNAAVKLAPATQVPDNWARCCELEWISRDRECRQLVAWHGRLAQSPGQRRATILAAASHLSPRTLVGEPNRPVSVAQQVARYIFDVDPAVLAAHLKGVVAAEHGLLALADGPTYLTGPLPIADVALACFEVDDVLPFEPRKLARYLAERSIGQLEIKKRGVEIDLEKLRRELKLRGDNAATLFVARIGGRSTAVVGNRIG